MIETQPFPSVLAKIVFIEKVNCLGMRAKSSIQAGTVLHDLKKQPVQNENNLFCITKKVGEYISTECSACRYFNHSCDPNVVVCFDDWTMRTCRDVAVDEELTFNYLTTELEMKEPFDCGCGCEKCFGEHAFYISFLPPIHCFVLLLFFRFLYCFCLFFYLCFRLVSEFVNEI